MFKKSILFILLMTVVTLFCGCIDGLMEEDPNTRTVKIEIVNNSNIPEGAKVVIQVVGAGSETIDVPGSKEFKIIADKEKSVNVNLNPHSLGTPIDLHCIQGSIKVYVDGSPITFTEASGADAYFLEFKVPKAPARPAEEQTH